MDFVAILDQVIALLRQRGRMAYRTLERQFPHSPQFSGWEVPVHTDSRLM